jgi:hypothetical protein
VHDRERLGHTISGDAFECFSSTVEGNELSEEQERAKRRLVVETAEEVWG